MTSRFRQLPRHTGKPCAANVDEDGDLVRSECPRQVLNASGGTGTLTGMVVREIEAEPFAPDTLRASAAADRLPAAFAHGREKLPDPAGLLTTGSGSWIRRSLLAKGLPGGWAPVA